MGEVQNWDLCDKIEWAMVFFIILLFQLYAIVDAGFLEPYDQKKKIYMQTDASKLGLGYFLYQIEGGNSEKKNRKRHSIRGRLKRRKTKDTKARWTKETKERKG